MPLQCVSWTAANVEDTNAWPRAWGLPKRSPPEGGLVTVLLAEVIKTQAPQGWESPLFALSMVSPAAGPDGAQENILCWGHLGGSVH